MLKVKHLTPFKRKFEKKGGNFYEGCKKKKIELSLILTKNLVLYRMQEILGR